MEQYFPASAAVAVGMVMVEADSQIIAKRIQLVVRELRQQPLSHSAGAGVFYTGMPANVVVPKALCQHRHIERRVMGHKQTVVHQRLKLRPQFRKSRRIRDKFRRNAGQFDVESVKMYLWVDQRIKLVGVFTSNAMYLSLILPHHNSMLNSLIAIYYIAAGVKNQAELAFLCPVIYWFTELL